MYPPGHALLARTSPGSGATFSKPSLEPEQAAPLPSPLVSPAGHSLLGCSLLPLALHVKPLSVPPLLFTG